MTTLSAANIAILVSFFVFIKFPPKNKKTPGNHSGRNQAQHTATPSSSIQTVTVGTVISTVLRASTLAGFTAGGDLRPALKIFLLYQI